MFFQPAPQQVQTQSQAEMAKQQTVKNEQNTKNLTQSEEEIKWNQWHSNLQNKIMQDVDLPDVPQGMAFKFIFFR